MNWIWIVLPLGIMVYSMNYAKYIYKKENNKLGAVAVALTSFIPLIIFIWIEIRP